MMNNNLKKLEKMKNKSQAIKSPMVRG